MHSWVELGDECFVVFAARSASRPADSLKASREIGDIGAVHYLYSEVIGPERLLLIAGVTSKGEYSQTELAGILRELEKRIMQHRFVGMAVLTLATPDVEVILSTVASTRS